MSGSTGRAPTPMSSIPRTSRAGPRRPLSSHSAQGPGSAPRWGRVLLSRPVLVVGQGMARRVVMAAVGRRRCWLSTHAIAPRGRAWTTAIAYESGREPTGGWDCSCSSRAGVSQRRQRRSHPGGRSSAHGTRFARRRESRVAWMGVAGLGVAGVMRWLRHTWRGRARGRCLADVWRGAEGWGAACAVRCGAGRWSGDVRLAAGRAVMRRWPQPAPRGASRCPRPRLSARRSPRCCPR
jgi:hypothetical protein